MKKNFQHKLPLLLLFIITLNIFSQSRNTVNGALSVNSSGAANYQIPFELPSFALDIFPGLGLSYSSQSNDGIAGYGWNITGLSSITRTGSVPIYDGVNKEVNFDNDDKFALDGQRLLIKSGTYGTDGAQYETSNYSNLKIVSVGVSSYGSIYGPAYFIVYYPNGSKFWYGQANNSHSRMEWALSKIEDTNGNIINLNYQSIVGNTLTIESVEDVGSDIVVNFEYSQKLRNDRSYYSTTIELANDNLLKTINVYTNQTNLYTGQKHLKP